ncbi:MAG: isochorismatase family protein [Sphingomicrobium sp.]
MTDSISPTLLTPETSAVLLIDYQQHVLKDITSADQALIALNGRALAHAARALEIPTVLSTIGVKLRGDPTTLPAVRAEVPDLPEIDRNTMNAWDHPVFRAAVEKTGRKRLIMAGLWTEVCLLYPVLNAQREGYETYIVVDAVGGATTASHDTAIRRMIQAGSQPVTLNSLILEWVRDWDASPHGQAAMDHLKWYSPLLAALDAPAAIPPKFAAAA